MEIDALLKATAERIANNWQDNITEAPTRTDYLYRLDAMDIAVNREGDGRFDVLDGIINEPVAYWVDAQPNRNELLDTLAGMVKERMQTWLTALGNQWKKEVEVLY